MKVTYNWLKEYVNIKVSEEKLAHLMTMAGLEVTSMENLDNDAVFEIEVTPNRPDCLSIIGIAREVSAITNSTFYPPKIIAKKESKAAGLNFSLTVLDKKACSRYVGRSLTGVKVGSSPVWLKNRLESVGIRSINNVVDITNYVLLETGQPLHAFDLDKLAERKIVVRRAKAGERIMTIDGEERKLNSDILVIADAKKPIAIAGIMGGLQTEVSENTKHILLESAYFDPVLIRRASRTLGLSSESSYRFERGVNKYNTSIASMRAVNLIGSIARSKLVQTQDCSTDKIKEIIAKIFLSAEHVNNLLGTDIAPAQIVSILKKLEFGVSKKTAKNFVVEIPSFRGDVKIEADLIEEIARIWGYEKISNSLPEVKIRDIEKQPLGDISNIIKDTLIGQGFSETIAYSLISSDLLRKANMDSKDATEIANPLSAEQELLRPTLSPGLLNCMTGNFNHNLDNVKIFELGNVVRNDKEIPTLGLAMAGLRYGDWLRRIKENVSLFDLKGVIEAIFLKLGIKDYKIQKKKLPYFKKGQSAIVKIKNIEVGFIGSISGELMDRWQAKKKTVFVAELNIAKILDFANLKKAFKLWINFPSVKRDISLVVNTEVPAEQIVKIATQEGGSYLKSITLLEQYTGEHIPSGCKGLSFSLEYQASDRTLKDEEVNAFHGNVCDALKNKIKVAIR